MLHKFDVWLIDKFERFSHKWQRMFGQDCFWWARVALAFSAISLFMYVFSFLSITVAHIVLCIVISPLSLGIWYMNIRDAEERVKMSHRVGLSNPLKQTAYQFRIALIVISVFFLCLAILIGHFLLFLVAASLFITTLDYFISCDPLPPSKSKVRQKLEAGIKKAKEFLAPEPELMPIPVPSR